MRPQKKKLIDANQDWFHQLDRKRTNGPTLSNSEKSHQGTSTISVHSGQYDDPISGAIGTPIYQNSTFYLSEPVYQGIHEGRGRDEMIYSRYGNPSQWAVQNKIAALENAESSIVFSSGMAAISSAILALMEKGGHLITSRDIYGGSYNLIYEDLIKFGMEVSFVDMTNLQEIEEAIKENTQLLFFETLTNPLLKLLDVEKVIQLGKKHQLRVILDNTFLTPYNLKPLDLGADVVVNSATKYLNGHSDLIAGTASSSRKLMDRIWVQMLKSGGSLDPHACFMLERGLKTFAIRMKAHNANSLELAEYLYAHPMTLSVTHPGLPNFEMKDIADQLLTKGHSGMITFVVKGGDENAHRLLEALHIPKQATSLGGVESLISLPYNSSQASLTRKQRHAIGIEDGTIRLSVGIEDIEDLINDFEQALTKLK